MYVGLYSYLHMHDFGREAPVTYTCSSITRRRVAQMDKLRAEHARPPLAGVPISRPAQMSRLERLLNVLPDMHAAETAPNTAAEPAPESRASTSSGEASPYDYDALRDDSEDDEDLWIPRHRLGTRAASDSMKGVRGRSTPQSPPGRYSPAADNDSSGTTMARSSMPSAPRNNTVSATAARKLEMLASMEPKRLGIPIGSSSQHVGETMSSSDAYSGSRRDGENKRDTERRRDAEGRCSGERRHDTDSTWDTERRRDTEGHRDAYRMHARPATHRRAVSTVTVVRGNDPYISPSVESQELSRSPSEVAQPISQPEPEPDWSAAFDKFDLVDLSFPEYSSDINPPELSVPKSSSRRPREHASPPPSPPRPTQRVSPKSSPRTSPRKSRERERTKVRKADPSVLDAKRAAIPRSKSQPRLSSDKRASDTDSLESAFEAPLRSLPEQQPPSAARIKVLPRAVRNSPLTDIGTPRRARKGGDIGPLWTIRSPTQSMINQGFVATPERVLRTPTQDHSPFRHGVYSPEHDTEEREVQEPPSERLSRIFDSEAWQTISTLPLITDPFPAWDEHARSVHSTPNSASQMKAPRSPLLQHGYNEISQISVPTESDVDKDADGESLPHAGKLAAAAQVTEYPRQNTPSPHSSLPLMKRPPPASEPLQRSASGPVPSSSPFSEVSRSRSPQLGTVLAGFARQAAIGRTFFDQVYGSLEDGSLAQPPVSAPLPGTMPTSPFSDMTPKTKSNASYARDSRVPNSTETLRAQSAQLPGAHEPPKAETTDDRKPESTDSGTELTELHIPGAFCTPAETEAPDVAEDTQEPLAPPEAHERLDSASLQLGQTAMDMQPDSEAGYDDDDWNEAPVYDAGELPWAHPAAQEMRENTPIGSNRGIDPNHLGMARSDPLDIVDNGESDLGPLRNDEALFRAEREAVRLEIQKVQQLERERAVQFAREEAEQRERELAEQRERELAEQRENELIEQRERERVEQRERRERRERAEQRERGRADKLVQQHVEQVDRSSSQIREQPEAVPEGQVHTLKQSDHAGNVIVAQQLHQQEEARLQTTRADNERIQHASTAGDTSAQGTVVDGNSFPGMQPQQSMIAPFELQGRTLVLPPGGRLENGLPVCVECMMRDEDMMDVDVIGSGVWERGSDAEFFDAIKQEHRHLARSQGDEPMPRILRPDGRPLTQVPVAKITYGDALTVENLTEHTKFARLSSAQRQRNTILFVQSQRVLLGIDKAVPDAPHTPESLNAEKGRGQAQLPMRPAPGASVPRSPSAQASPVPAAHMASTVQASPQPSHQTRMSPAINIAPITVPGNSSPSVATSPIIGSPPAPPDSAMAMVHDRGPGTPGLRVAGPAESARPPKVTPSSSRSPALREKPSLQHLAAGLEDLMPPARPFVMDNRAGSALASPTPSDVATVNAPVTVSARQMRSQEPVPAPAWPPRASEALVQTPVSSAPHRPPVTETFVRGPPIAGAPPYAPIPSTAKVNSAPLGDLSHGMWEAYKAPPASAGTLAPSPLPDTAQSMSAGNDAEKDSLDMPDRSADPNWADESMMTYDSGSEPEDDTRRRRQFRGFFRKIVGARPQVGPRDDAGGGMGIPESPGSVRTTSSNGLWQRISRPRSSTGHSRRRGDNDVSFNKGTGDTHSIGPGRRRTRTHSGSADVTNSSINL